MEDCSAKGSQSFSEDWDFRCRYASAVDLRNQCPITVNFYCISKDWRVTVNLTNKHIILELLRNVCWFEKKFNITPGRAIAEAQYLLQNIKNLNEVPLLKQFLQAKAEKKAPTSLEQHLRDFQTAKLKKGKIPQSTRWNVREKNCELSTGSSWWTAKTGKTGPRAGIELHSNSRGTSTTNVGRASNQFFLLGLLCSERCLSWKQF